MDPHRDDDQPEDLLMQSEPEGTTRPPEQPSEAASGRPVFVNLHEVQPESQLPDGHLYHEDAAGSDYVLIQFNKVPTQEELLQLYSLGVQVSQLSLSMRAFRSSCLSLPPVLRMPGSAHLAHKIPPV